MENKRFNLKNCGYLLNCPEEMAIRVNDLIAVRWSKFNVGDFFVRKIMIIIA